MTWKKALYNYGNAKNQAELEGSVEPLAALLEDKVYVDHQHARLRQTALLRQERGTKPLRNETALKWSQIEETDTQVIADIQLHRTFHYAIGRVEHIEERIELERVTLNRKKNGWQVLRSEARQSEKSPKFANAHPSAAAGKASLSLMADEQASMSHQRMPSIPYINYSILNKEEILPRKIRYDRDKVVQYAEAWWNKPNPKYLEFAVDCTNFVSQCLYAGNAPMDYTGKRESGWWYSGKQGNRELWSFSWAVAHSLQSFTAASRKGMRGTIVSKAQELRPGDMISYDWDGDGRYQHNTIVTALDANGMPLVNAHTYNSRNRYWDYRDSPAWTERTRYVFVQIADEM